MHQQDNDFTRIHSISKYPSREKCFAMILVAQELHHRRYSKLLPCRLVLDLANSVSKTLRLRFYETVVLVPRGFIFPRINLTSVVSRCVNIRVYKSSYRGVGVAQISTLLFVKRIQIFLISYSDLEFLPRYTVNTADCCTSPIVLFMLSTMLNFTD